ncbi:ABZJ_00895 family protein [Labrys sp. ZIDIC5]|uniref:ABZJ_00895 family protein n=1 Tax=Labrys sedimenti TaxID=3106036 RepID=UPI002ACA07FE|nr:ABZJ_00895 family protein [Labrys sp. ZIDIC5]MDZ5448320.1 ABZJ_00895 family protein [Labrys sp. ZIDIC5]
MDSYVPATNTVSFGAVVFRFSWIYVLAAIAVVVIAFLLEAFLHIDMSKNSFLGVLPLMTAGSGTGKYYATRTGMKPRGVKAWLIALVGFVISLAFNLAVIFGFIALTDSWQELGSLGSFRLRGDEQWLVPLALGGLFLLFVALTRLFLWMGANPVVKKMRKDATSAF